MSFFPTTLRSIRTFKHFRSVEKNYYSSAETDFIELVPSLLLLQHEHCDCAMYRNLTVLKQQEASLEVAEPQRAISESECAVTMHASTSLKTVCFYFTFSYY